MSSFQCEKCGANIIDTDDGYVTGCEHHPIEETTVSDLKPCPCGKMPKELSISQAHAGYKWAYVSGDCCGDWEIEFRTGGHKLDSIECMNSAIKYWNDAKRDDGWISVGDRLPDEGNYVLTAEIYSNGKLWADGCVINTHIFDNNEWYNEGTCKTDKGITHWKPLPEPPEVK